MSHSVPPGSGPSFNQILVIFLIAAIVILGALMIFDPQMRHHNVHNPQVPPIRTSDMNGPPN